MATVVNKSFVESIVNDPSILLLDVREADEYEAGFIPSAKNLSVNDIPSSLALDKQDFLLKYKFEKPDVNYPILVYCRSGRRSAKAALSLKEAGYLNLKDYSGGYQDWSS
ncbi:Rhodanese-like domain-containing protein [Globomyces pollinis-pini]|nr:Rhodanese-like domain-containing protein [Globomyces pollinis-pini]